MSEPEKPETKQAPANQENALVSLAFNLFLPAFVLLKLSGDPTKEEQKFYVVGPEWALVIACLLPLGYGIYDYAKRRQINFFSVLGLVVVLMKGAFGLFKLPAVAFAWSEASLPLLFGIAILWTSRWDPPLVQKLLLNPQAIDLDKIRERLKEAGSPGKLAELMRKASFGFFGILVFSAILNFVLALRTIKSDPHADYSSYIQDLGRFQVLQFPVISLPLMVLMFGLVWYVVAQLLKETNLRLGEIVIGAEDVEDEAEKA